MRRQPNSGSFRPGQTSANPKGRPRTGFALAERIRETVDPDELISIVLSIARSSKAPPQARLAAVTVLADRGWIKPVTQLEIEAALQVRAELHFDDSRLDDLTEEELAILAKIDRPRVPDDDAPR